MLTSNIDPETKEAYWEMESDLPSLACHAATELDNIILSRSFETNAIRHLESKITKWLKIDDFTNETPLDESFLFQLDPTFVIVLIRAFADSKSFHEQISSLDELIKQTNINILSPFRSICSDPNGFACKPQNSKILQVLRGFCLALYRHAVAYEQSLFNLTPRFRLWR